MLTLRVCQLAQDRAGHLLEGSKIHADASKSNVAVDQESMLIVATALSNHPNDKQEAEPTLEALSPQPGQPQAGALDNGYCSKPSPDAFAARGIEPYIASGLAAAAEEWCLVCVAPNLKRLHALMIG